MSRTIAILLSLLAIGCGNLSPRQRDLKIDNKDGKIDNLENNIGSLRLELGRQQQKNELLNSELENLQQGYINLNNRLAGDNFGTQILTGSGPLAIIFALVVISMLLKYMQDQVDKNRKIAELLMDQIKQHNDPSLEEKMFSAAAYTDVEKDILSIYDKRSAPRGGIDYDASDSVGSDRDFD